MRDSTFQSTIAVQGIHPTLVDRSSDEEQPRTSLSGDRFAALIDDESCVDDGEGSERNEGPEFVMDENVPGSSTDTETVGEQSEVEGPVEHGLNQSPCRKPILPV